MLRTRAVWTGVAGTPYYTTFYWGGTGQALADAAQSQMISWMEVVAQFVNDALSIQAESEVLEINPATGEAFGLYNVAGSTSVGLNTSEPLPFQVQALTFLGTTAFRKGRRVRGRNFLPGLTELPNTSGSGPGETTREQIQTLYSTFLTDGPAVLQVWSRPTPDEPGETNNVTSFQTSPIWSTLRSRRAA